MKNIIVPVDFSAAAENAANYAACMADFYGAELWLYHTYLLPMALPEYGYPLTSSAELEATADTALNEMAERIRKNISHPLIINIKVELNYLQEGLSLFCTEKNADLVVMGLSGKDALTRLVVGSNTIKAIHYIKCPVLIVPPKAAFKMIHKIGFACDYLKVDETTPVNYLRDMVQLFNAELHVINVDWHNRHFAPDEQFLLHMNLHDLNVKYHHIESEEITGALNKFAQEEDIDLLIAIPKKHNLVEKLFSHSKTQDLIYHANLPVLCMHE